jgi:hypothetical protein
MIDPIFVVLWMAYHAAVIAYFNHRLNEEERSRERREQARRQRLVALGFRTRASPAAEPQEEIVFLA